MVERLHSWEALTFQWIKIDVRLEETPGKPPRKKWILGELPHKVDVQQHLLGPGEVPVF